MRTAVPPRGAAPSLAALVLVTGSVRWPRTRTSGASRPAALARYERRRRAAEPDGVPRRPGLRAVVGRPGQRCDRAAPGVAVGLARLRRPVRRLRLAPTGALLVAARLLQGLAAGGGVAAGRAVVSDHFSGSAAAERYGTLASIALLAPVIAPPVGSAILSVGSWRTVFGVLSVLGVAMVAGVLMRIPESLPSAARQGGSLGATGRRAADLLRDRGYTPHVVVQAFATMGFFTYIGGSSFALQTVYGISQSRYALVFTVNARHASPASVVFRLFVARVGAARLRLTGLCLAARRLRSARGRPRRDAKGALARHPVGAAVLPDGRHGTHDPRVDRAGAGGGTAIGRHRRRALRRARLPRRRARHAAHRRLGYSTLLPMALLMTGFFTASALALAASRPPQPHRARPQATSGASTHGPHAGPRPGIEARAVVRRRPV